MKTIVYVLIGCFLFQSCFNYKKIPFSKNEIIPTKKYRFTLSNFQKMKGKVIKATFDSVFFENKKQLYGIPFNSIKGIETRKYSFFKTTILSIIVAIPVIVILIDQLKINFKVNPFKNII